jgi:L-alanine-DL-glutamate epimerase-like enolase superfamily enzyme
MMTRKAFFKSVAGAAAALGVAGSRPLSALSAGPMEGTPQTDRITSCELFPFSIPLNAVQHIALGTTEVVAGVFVRLRTASGATGWGECSPYHPVMSETQATDVAMGRALVDVVRGRNPFEIPAVVAAMDRFTPESPGIKAAFEMALWDLCGKLSGQPVVNLLGRCRDTFETDQTVLLDTPEIMAGKALDIAARGFRVVKIKVGQGPDLDIARLQAIREAIGHEVRIRIDANQGWVTADAIRVLHAVEPLDIEFCEQPGPYWSWPAMRTVREKVNIPIMADESVRVAHDAIAGIREGAMDSINIKLMKSGGILHGARIAHVAEAASLRCMVGCMNETRLGLAAAAHLVASQPNIVYADLDASLFHGIDPIVGGIRIERGVVSIPETPGLGVEVDPAFLKTLQRLT